MLDSPVRPGEVIAGKYRVDRILGAGGMGVVVAATHTLLKQPVAVKFLLPDGSDSAAAQMRFMREGQTAARIKSEHVARVIDLGTTDSGLLYMAMELLDGSDLAQVIASRGPLPIPVAIDWVLQASEAIAEAHALGMVHRDLKPANLFLTKRPDGSPLVKVLDFGISKSTIVAGGGTHVKSLTSDGGVIGTPAYMSPEQIKESKRVDARSDIWSIGMILYELLTGRIAFDASTVSALLARIMTDPPVPLQTYRPEVPESLAGVVHLCLSKSPSERPQTMSDLAKLLAPFAPPESQPSIARIGNLIAPSSSPMMFEHTVEDPASSPTMAAPSKAAKWSTTGGVGLAATQRDGGPPRKGLFVVLLLVMIGGVGGATWWRSMRTHADSEPNPNPIPTPSTPVVASASPLPAPSVSLSVPIASSSASVALALSPAPVPVVSASSAKKHATPRKPTSTSPHAPATAPPAATTEGDALGGAIDNRR